MAFLIVFHVNSLVIHILIQPIDLPAALGLRKCLYVGFTGIMASRVTHIYRAAFTRSAAHTAEFSFNVSRTIDNTPAERTFRSVLIHLSPQKHVKIYHREYRGSYSFLSFPVLQCTIYKPLCPLRRAECMYMSIRPEHIIVANAIPFVFYSFAPLHRKCRILQCPLRNLCNRGIMELMSVEQCSRRIKRVWPVDLGNSVSMRLRFLLHIKGNGEYSCHRIFFTLYDKAFT